MRNLKYGTNEMNMAQILFLQNRNKFMDLENKLVVAKGEGEGKGRTGSLGLADVNCYIQDGETTRFYCIAQGAIFTIL